MKRSGKVLLGVLALILAAGLPAQSAKNAPATLRVGLWTLWHDKTVTASPAGALAFTLRTCVTCAAQKLAQSTQIRATGDLVELSDGRKSAAILLEGSVILAAHAERLTLGNPVRIAARNGELVLAVTLPVEAYVERVVASESNAADTPESLKALAIVVRSFALHQAHGHADFDLCDSTHCQLLRWSGTSAPGRKADAHAATLATAGETLWFHGQRAAAWFHQNCGGRTASPGEVWPARSAGAPAPMPWLASRPDPWCAAGGARAWSASLTLSQLTQALAASGLAQPGWTSLTVARRGESGRAETVLVDSKPISAEDFRLAVGRSLGWGKILSTWFEVARQQTGGEMAFVFHGRGSGHGVGLCQAGAAAMGAHGQSFEQILAQYFPGANAADEATGLSWQGFRGAGPGSGFTLESLDSSDQAYLPQLDQALAEAAERSGFEPSQPITVRAFRSTGAFRNATQAPGWVAAFTEGDWIAAQPLKTLAARKLLAGVMRHEFLHSLIEAQAAPGTPLWLREGLAEVWADDAHAPIPRTTIKLDDVDGALAHAASEAQSQAAHKAAAFYAARLLGRYGKTQVQAWLHTGLPASALAAVR